LYYEYNGNDKKKNPEILLMSPELKETQNIMPMSPEDRERLKEDIENNGMRHPIICYNKDGKYFVLAGWNRREIAIELNTKIVDIQIVEGETAEFETFVITENLSRRHLTSDHKKKLIAYLLKINPEKSDRGIGRLSGSDNKTVATVRKKWKQVRKFLT
jgi:ParB-like nuclease domain.